MATAETMAQSRSLSMRFRHVGYFGGTLKAFATIL